MSSLIRNTQRQTWGYNNMTEPTPHSNELKITKLEGQMGSFEKEIEGLAKLQEQSTNTIRDSVVEMAKTSKENREHNSELVAKMFKKIEQNEAVATRADIGLENFKGEHHRNTIRSRWIWGIVITVILAFIGLAVHG